MSTFIVFGASGPVGRFLLPRLGGEVFAVSRSPPPDASGTHWIRGDLFGSVAPLPAQTTVIVSLGPLEAFAAWFAATPVAGVRRVLALSSMSAQSKRASPDAAERALAARLIAAETRIADVAVARGIRWTLFRPTLIYGGGQRGSLAPIVEFARRWHVLPYPLGASGLRQPVHAEDIATAVRAAIDARRAWGRIYELGGGERLRCDDMLLRLRAAVPGFVVPLPLPAFVLRLRSAIRGSGGPFSFGVGALQRLREPLVADNARAAADLGYAPRAFAAAEVLA